MTGTTTDLSRPRFARMYLRTSKNAEARGATEHRRRLLDGLHGTVLELGAGHGLNFPHYPAEVSEVIAIEPEPTLRARATEAAASAPVPVRVLAGVADELPVADESVDAAVTSLVLCSVPDQRRALAELRRVLRPGGELRFYEHVIPRCQPERLLLQPPTTAACGRSSPAAATPPATPPPRSSRPAFRSSQASGSCSPPRRSSRGSPTSSAWRDEPEPIRTFVRPCEGTW
jgi:SAM-dependent methyltransferase